MSNTTKVKTEHVHLTEEHVGRVWVDRYVYEHTMGWDGSIRKERPKTVVNRYVIVTVKPADAAYGRMHPDAGPRVEVEMVKIRPNETAADALARHESKPARLAFKLAQRFLPTIGNEKTVEIEVAK